MASKRASVAASAAIGLSTPQATPLASPVATPDVDNSGIVWPASQPLPTFRQPQELFVANLDNATPDEQLLFVSLQGLVNRTEPRIYFTKSQDEGETTWLDNGLGVTWHDVDDPWELFDRLSFTPTSIVVTDDAVEASVNVATTIGGLTGSLIVAPSILKEFQKRFPSASVEHDLRARFASNLDAHRWQFTNLWPKANHRVLMGLDPVGVRAETRDFAIAVGAMPFWLDPNVDDERALFEEIMNTVDDYTPYLGWFSQDVSGEFSGTELCSSHGVFVLAADWLHNLTVWCGTRRGEVTASSATAPALQNKMYITFVMSEGDNLQYCQHRLRMLWDDPARGSVPISWTINPMLHHAGPAMLNYYLTTASAADCFVVGPSGAGYMNPCAWPPESLGIYLEHTREYMAATGMETVYVLNRQNGEDVPLSDGIAKAYNTQLRPSGLFLNWQPLHRNEVLAGDLPESVVVSAGTIGNIQTALEIGSKAFDGTKPVFGAIGVLAWDTTVADLKGLVAKLDDRYEVVRADEYFQLMRAWIDRNGGKL